MSYDLASRRIIFQDGSAGFCRRYSVHMSAGYGISGAMFLGKRKLKSQTCTYYLCIAGTGLLWFGWFGFNAGSALSWYCSTSTRDNNCRCCCCWYGLGILDKTWTQTFSDGSLYWYCSRISYNSCSWIKYTTCHSLVYLVVFK
jgi:hypothetical protein